MEVDEQKELRLAIDRCPGACPRAETKSVLGDEDSIENLPISRPSCCADALDNLRPEKYHNY